MTDATAPATGEEQAPGWPEERKERAAMGCLLVIAIGAGGAVAVAIPETAYYAAGLGTAAAVRKVRSWVVGRRQQTDDEPDELEDTVDIIAALHELSPGGTANVRLTQLADAVGLISTQTVRALLAEAGIDVRDGVRAGGRNGPGVHHTDIPRTCGAPSDECWCRSDANTNANNTPAQGPEKGLRVDAIGHAGLVVTDPTEAQRRHTKAPARST